MVCKMLFFDCSDGEKLFFQNNEFPNYEIKFFKNSLNKKTIKELSSDDINQTAALSIFTPSQLSAEIINEFPNLRVISTRSKSYGNIDLKQCLERNIAVVNVETTNKCNENHILIASMKAVTNVFCGCKENRIV